jgi:hypothetical protein
METESLPMMKSQITKYLKDSNFKKVLELILLCKEWKATTETLKVLPLFGGLFIALFGGLFLIDFFSIFIYY